MRYDVARKNNGNVLIEATSEYYKKYKYLYFVQKRTKKKKADQYE